ncbi:MAG: hypothetical protein EXS14_02500 [Planctomycetes bacterium]|nr:hypothetical protein [Planctomycetota bacterium]
MQKFLLIIMSFGVLAAFGQVQSQEPTEVKGVAPVVRVEVAAPAQVRCTQTASTVELSAGLLDTSVLLRMWSEASSRRFILVPPRDKSASIMLSGPMSIPKERVDVVFEALLEASGHVLYEGASPHAPSIVESARPQRAAAHIANMISVEQISTVAHRGATIYSTLLPIPAKGSGQDWCTLASYYFERPLESAHIVGNSIWVTARGSTLSSFAALLKACEAK